MNKIIFNVIRTYEIVTPESAENCDFEECGTEWESDCDLRDVLFEIKEIGVSNIQSWNKEINIEGYTYTDYRYSSETTNRLTITGPERAISRLHKVLKAKFNK